MIPLTDRCYCIIEYLLKQSKKVTIKEIAEHFKVSERTVRYDLDVIADWLKEKGITLKKKSRVGVWIENPKESCKKLKGQLDFTLPHYQVFSFEERKKIILNILFERQKPVSIRELADRLNVSRTTIINDLDGLEKWLEKRGIQLIRKPNYGIAIKCDEISWRKGVIDYISENIDKTTILEFLNITRLNFVKNSRIDFLTNKQIADLFSELDIMQLEECINFIEKELNIKFVDAALAGLIMHLALAIKRLKQEKQIIMAEEQLITLRNTEEFEVAKVVAKRLESNFNLNIPESEIGYITLHILGAKVRENFTIGNKDIVDSNSEDVALVKKLIERAGLFLKIDLGNDKELEKSLLIHLKPTITRLKYGMNIFNPLLNEIKSRYPEVFEASKWACKMMEQEMGITLNEDEVGYIAMHIGASLERNRYYLTKKRFKAIIVCSSGIGTAKMLSSRLEMEFPNILIKKEISLAELEENISDDVDFIITTIPIENVFFKPVLHVSPLLTKKDMDVIQNLIDIGRQSERKFGKTVVEDLLKIIEKNCTINNYANLTEEIKKYFNINPQHEKGEKLPMLLDLITEKTIELNVEADDWKDAIRKSGQLLVEQGFVEPGYIDAMIKTAESMKAYIVIAPGVALPHARPEKGVNRVCMSLITLKKPVEFGHPKNDPVKIVISLGAVDNHTHLKALSELSSFLDSETNIDKLTECDSIKQVLELFKKQKVS